VHVVSHLQRHGMVAGRHVSVGAEARHRGRLASYQGGAEARRRGKLASYPGEAKMEMVRHAES